MAAKKALKTTQKKTSAKKADGSKAQFIRSLPSNTPAAEVVAKAKAAGIEVTPAYVYVLRSHANRKAAKAKSTGAVATKIGKGRASSAGATTPETSLRKAVAELGLTKAREIFAAVEKAFAGS